MNISQSFLLSLALLPALAVSLLSTGVTVDYSVQKPVSPTLWGIFFEEINHAMEGGLYAEMLQDRSFDWQAMLTNFVAFSTVNASNPLWIKHCANYAYVTDNYGPEDDMDSSFYAVPALNGNTANGAMSLWSYDEPGSYLRVNATDGFVYIEAASAGDDTFNDDASWMLQPSIIIANAYTLTSLSTGDAAGWLMAVSPTADHCGGGFGSAWPHVGVVPPHVGKGSPAAQWVTSGGLPGKYPRPQMAWTTAPSNAQVTVQVSTKYPLNPNNTNALYVATSSGFDGTGIQNSGFWGISVVAQAGLTVSLYARSDDSAPPALVVSLMSYDGSVSYGSATTPVVTDEWQQYTVELFPTATDSQATFWVTLPASASVYLDVVSMMPTANVLAGHPFRADLLEMLQRIGPKFMRMPGGTYVDGVEWFNRYQWENTVGPIEQRPGHYDDIWGYWTTDGLGYYELLILAELLDAEPIWVLNCGISLTVSIPTGDLQPYIQSGLDSLEFAIGDVSTPWGALRASMGHPQPFAINYVAIGNEQSQPQYTDNYIAFYETLKASYPNITLIANSPMGSSAPTDMYDFHTYNDPFWFIDNQFYFDSIDRSTSPLIFNSEYAVYGEWGGTGNLNGSLAEAVWMTALERNSDLVPMASYAPLFVNTNDRTWNPDAIVFNSNQTYGTPSYWNQVMFANYAGMVSLGSELAVGSNNSVGFSATCVDQACKQLYLKIVNVASVINSVKFNLVNCRYDVEWDGVIVTLTGSSLAAENSFEEPEAVVPISSSLQGLGNSCTLQLQPWSTNIITLNLS